MLRVNPIKCTAFGFCAEHAPELFSLDDWGYAWLHSRDVPTALESLAHEVCRLCPTGALTVAAAPLEQQHTSVPTPQLGVAASQPTLPKSVR